MLMQSFNATNGDVLDRARREEKDDDTGDDTTKSISDMKHMMRAVPSWRSFFCSKFTESPETTYGKQLEAQPSLRT
jgi:hypothetical protein